MKSLIITVLIVLAGTIIYAQNKAETYEPSESMNDRAKADSIIKSVNAQYTQCTAITADGDRCKRKTKNASGLCTQHETLKPAQVQVKVATVQCTAITTKGVQCRNVTSDPSGKCWQHR